MDQQYKILLTGPQGSGKGTQAELLSQKIGVPSFGMGQLLRNEISAGSDIGKKIDEILKAGVLVSDELAVEVLKTKLSSPEAARGYILDGYPRNAKQLAAFNFETPTHVIVIDVPDAESLRRLQGRLTCDHCGKVFNEKDGAHSGDACVCGGIMKRRDDDTDSAIRQRLKIYHSETESVIAEYEKRGVVHRVDGVGSVAEVHERIMSALE